MPSSRRQTARSPGPTAERPITPRRGARPGRTRFAPAVEGLESRRLLTTINEFPVPAAFGINGITGGPDGNVWFTEDNGNIGRITPDGHVTEFPIQANPTYATHPDGITTGGDGNLWFAESGPFSETTHNHIGQMSPEGVILNEFAIATFPSTPRGIALGSDGNVWFPEYDSSRIGRIKPDGTINEYVILGFEPEPLRIVAGPDGNLWFTENNSKSIGRITTGGSVSQYPVADYTYEIAAGADGNLWFTDVDGRLARIAPPIHSEIPVPIPVPLPTGVFPEQLAKGPDGNIWFTDYGHSQIDQITPAGVLKRFALPTDPSYPTAITTGPDGNIWFAEGGSFGHTIGQLVLDAPGTAPDLALSGSAPDSVSVKENLTYSFTVTNDGTSGASGVTLTDTLPAGVAFVSATGGVMPVNGVLTFHLGNLAKGASDVVTIVVTPTAVGTLNNQATISGNDDDATPADNSLTQTTTVTPPVGVPDLALSGSAPSLAAVGQNVTYTFAVTNLGSGGATGVTLKDTLPANAAFVSATGGVLPVGGVVTFDLGSLAIGASATVTIVVTPTATGTLTNEGDVSGNENEANLANNQLTQTTSVESFVVNTTDDELIPGDGKTSLREAVTLANALGGGTITFDPAVFAGHETITLSRVLPDLSGTARPETIIGPGAGVTIARSTAAGTPKFRILTVDKDVSASMSNLTVTGGFDDVLDVAGILSLGTLTATDCTIIYNAGSGIASGDGTYKPTGPLTLIHCTISNNAASIDGGGVFNFQGTMTLANCTIADNTAVRNGGGIGNLGTLTVTGSTLSGNSAGQFGGAIFTSTGNLSLIDCTLASNAAGASGGGIEAQGNITVTCSTFSLNSAAFGGGIDNYFGGYKVTIADSILAGDLAPAGPDFVNTVISLGNNLIGKIDGSLGWIASDLTGTVVAPLDPVLGPLQDNGGPTPTLALLDGSPAFDAGGNALVPAGVTTDQRGLPRTFNGTVDIGAFESQRVLAAPSLVVNTTDDSLIPRDGKTSLREAVALANALGGRIITFDPAVFPSGNASTIQLLNDAAHRGLELKSNVTIVGPGANALAIKGGGFASDFSVLRVDTGVTAAISGLTISDGRSSTNGGGISNQGTLALTNCTVTSNSAAGFGGGIYSTGSLALTNCDLSSNVSAAFGGGLSVNGGSTQISGGRVDGNKAGTSGAGIEADSGTMMITGTAVTGNKSSGTGGGIRNLGTMRLLDVTIIGNSAFSASGGIINRDGTLTMVDCAVMGNMAAYNGGAANNGAGVMSMTGCTVAFNMATSGKNGGIGNGDSGDSVSMTLVNCTIANNTAITTGGGIGNVGTLLLTNCTVAGNAASGPAGLGGGIYFEAGKVTLRNTIVAGNLHGAGPSIVPSDIAKKGAAVSDFASAYNLIGTGGSGDLVPGAFHNRVLLDPILGPLQDNGGPTQTMALLDGSPAFNAGNNLLVPGGVTTEQRGLPRVFGGIVDIGAFESQKALSAPSLVVNSTGDDLTVGDNKTTLREALILTNNKLGGGTITFAPAVFPADGAATIQIIGTLAIGSDVRIVGPGATALTIIGGGPKSNFSVFSVGNETVSISGLTITGGHVSLTGGGIFNSGQLTLTDCTVDGNASDLFGGGIYNTGTLTINRCAIWMNKALQGGGLFASGSLPMTLINTTVAVNFASNEGGGIANYKFGSSITLNNCTVAGNSAGARFGGIVVTTNVMLRNTIVAGNSSGVGVGNKPDNIGVLVGGGRVNPSSSYNLIGLGYSGGLVNGINHNSVGVDPLLGSLRYNGGPTPTMAILAGSPALDAGSNALLPPGNNSDQRGQPRVSNGTVDIGAYEAQAVAPAPNLIVNTTADEVVAGSGKTSLRGAILLANSLGGGTIRFDPAVFPAGGSATIELRSDALHDVLLIQSNVTIVGPGANALTVRGTGLSVDSSVFFVGPVTAAISGLTVTGGYASSGGGIGNIGTLTLTDVRIGDNYATDFGGGVYNGGILTILDCTVANNACNATGPFGAYGGGIFSSGTLTMRNTTVSGNSANVGGGIDFVGMLTMTNCTVTRNQGSFLAGGIVARGLMIATNDTVVANRAINDAGGGIAVLYRLGPAGSIVPGRVILRNTIVAGNFHGAVPSPAPGDIFVYAGGIMDPSSSYNLIGIGGAGGMKDRSADPAHNNRVGVTNLRLGSLQNNGGPTQTIALLAGSPAIDAGSNALAAGIATDQRGMRRVFHTNVDIGAYELQ
jgi:uncharacterized repeat protein (TIGR01451 family)/CSLREA domain-containing protein